MSSYHALSHSDAKVLMGIISSARSAEQHVIKHWNTAHSIGIRYDVWFGLSVCSRDKILFSGSGAGSKVRSGLHEPGACQVKHRVDKRRHLLAPLSRDFLLDAARNNEVTQDNKVNQQSQAQAAVVCLKMAFTMTPEGAATLEPCLTEGVKPRLCFPETLRRPGEPSPVTSVTSYCIATSVVFAKEIKICSLPF